MAPQWEADMLRERVADEIFVFTSELYLQATASAIITSEGVVVIDTLPFPQETREMLRFIEKRGKSRIRYVILTHYHPDHTYGACFVPGEVIGHERCRRILDRNGERILQADQARNPELADVRVRLPGTVFDRGTISLHVGKKTITLLHTPGHTTDSISAYIKEDKILFAGDLIMPVPYIVGGDRDQMRESLAKVADLGLDNIVQGHGDVLLRGEITETIDTSLKYLDAIEAQVKQRIAKNMPKSSLHRLDIERCHKSRIPLNGLVEELHQANLSYLYDILSSQSETGAQVAASDDRLLTI
jgi:glyoxylase-like metal-dependent hydrolase (beta-lactamase superfamily II)